MNTFPQDLANKGFQVSSTVISDDRSTVYQARNAWNNQEFIVESFNPQVSHRDVGTVAAYLRQNREPFLPVLTAASELATDGSTQAPYLVYEIPNGTLASALGNASNWGNTAEQKLSSSEAAAAFRPLAEAIDSTDEPVLRSALAANLDPRRVIIGYDRHTAQLLTFGPAMNDLSATTRFAELLQGTCSSVVTAPASEPSSARDLLTSLDSPKPTTNGWGAVPQASGGSPSANSGWDSPSSSWEAPQAKQESGAETTQFAPVQKPVQETGWAAPQQQAPSPATEQTPASATAGHPNADTTGSSQRTAVRKKKSHAGMWGTLAATLVLVLAAVGGVMWWQHNKEWEEPERALADDYPSLLGSHDGAAGQGDTTCRRDEPEDGQEAKITCNGEELNYSAAHFKSEDEKLAAQPDSEPDTLSNGVCTVESYKMDGADTPIFFLTEKGSDNAFLVWGDDAENKRLDLPLCSEDSK